MLVVPHRDGTFDHRRPVTALTHLLEDFEVGRDEGDLTHLEEVLELHDLALDEGIDDREEFVRRCKANAEKRCLHHHVFNTHLVVAMLDSRNLQLLRVVPYAPFHIAVLAIKPPPGEKANNARFLGQKPCWKSPFLSDH